VHVDPIKPRLKPPRTKRFNLKYDELLSNFAFKSNVRRFNMDMHFTIPVDATVGVFSRTGRGLHWSTSELNLSHF